MNPRRPRIVLIGALGALLLLHTMEASTLAQSGSAPQVTTSPFQSDQDIEIRRNEARTYFESGLALFEKEAWEAALVEFVRSRATYSTRAATENAAFCLRHLQRFDAAIAMFEEMLTFSNLSDEKRKVAERAIAELQEQVGTLQIASIEVGATIVVDGRFRGMLPLTGPLRLSAGRHEVRVLKEGLNPFEGTFEIKGKQETVVKLPWVSVGRLEVSEQNGRALDVVIDGTVRGTTPWDGPLAPGPHVVFLRGRVDIPPDSTPTAAGASTVKKARLDSAEFDTPPMPVSVRLREVTSLKLTAKELDASMLIQPTPAGAAVEIDSVFVGWGTWEGRMHVGQHKVEVTAEGYPKKTRQVTLESGKRQTVAIDLTLDEQAARKKPNKMATVATVVAYGVGAVGLSVFAITGSVALAKSNAIKPLCDSDYRCIPLDGNNKSLTEDLNAMRTLGTVSTVGLVVGGIGVVAGTIVVIAQQPGGNDPRVGAPSGQASAAGGVLWNAGVGLGRFTIQGSF